MGGAQAGGADPARSGTGGQGPAGRQAGRPGAEDRHAVALPDPGQLGGVPAGHGGVGEQHEGVLEAVPRLPGSGTQVASAKGTRSSSAWAPRYGPIPA